MSNNLIYIYVGKIKDFQNYKTLPKYCLEEIKNIKNENVKKQKISSYVLLKEAVKNCLNKNENFENFYKNENGKPLTNDYCFSISHSKDLVCIAVSLNNVGIDIQFVNNKTDIISLNKRILNIEEKEPKNYLDTFTLWANKEAMFKLNNGKIFIPKEINTNEFNFYNKIINYKDDTYVLSATAEDISNINFIDLT